MALYKYLYYYCYLCLQHLWPEHQLVDLQPVRWLGGDWLLRARPAVGVGVAEWVVRPQAAGTLQQHVVSHLLTRWPVRRHRQRRQQGQWDGVKVRALCRIKLLPVTHVLVDTWLLTVKPVYKLSDVPDDLKWATNTHGTIYTHFQGITNNIYGFGRPFSLLLHFLPIHPPPVHPYFFCSFVF